MRWGVRLASAPLLLCLLVCLALLAGRGASLEEVPRGVEYDDALGDTPLVLRARRHDGRGYGGLVPPFALPWSSPGGNLVVPFFCPGGSLRCHGELDPIAVGADDDAHIAAFPHWEPQHPDDAHLAALDPSRPTRTHPLPFSPWGDTVPPLDDEHPHVGTVVVDPSAFRAYAASRLASRNQSEL